MKKLTAIFFLFIFLFNIGGYRLWFYYSQQISDERLEVSLDKNEYNEADLVTIKIPISLPYQTNWKEFERIDGDVNLNGKIYKYVKRKVHNGELILLCIPDHNKMKLESARYDFFKIANDLVQNNVPKKSGNPHTAVFKLLFSEYYQNSYDYFNNDLIEQNQNFSFYKAHNLSSLPHISPEQPPDNKV